MDRSYHRAAYEHHRAKAAAYRTKAEGHLARASAHRSRLGFGAKTYGVQITKRPDHTWNCDCCNSQAEHFEKLKELDKARAEEWEGLNETNRTKPHLYTPGIIHWRP